MKEQKPKYNQGDILGYRDCFYVITRVVYQHNSTRGYSYYEGYITGRENKELNNTKDIDNNKDIRLVARGQ